MRALIVLAHPLKPSLSARFADGVAAHFAARGSQVQMIDLYKDGFDPVLSADERAHYYKSAFADDAGLQSCTHLVLIFPTWWFGMPAILKGWIDRSFVPGVAYDHAADLSALSPRLAALREVLVITTLGSPWWVDWLVLRRPVRRALKWGVVKACAPKARFRLLSLYGAEQVTPAHLSRFSNRINKTLERMI